MAVYEVFTHPELRRYRASVCSKATLFMFGILVLTFIPPLFVVYRSHGFWQKEAYYREFPAVTFKRDLMIVVELQDSGEYVTYSTYQKYNLLQQERLRVPVIKTREEDSNGDGQADRMVLNIEMPLTDAENVVGVKLLLFYYYRLQKFSSFYMESLGYIEHFSPNPGAELEVFGTLRFRQKQPLNHRGIDTRYNGSLINQTSTFADTYELSTIFRSYSQRNASTMLEDQYKIWKSGRGTGKPFLISATIDYPEDVYLYTPGFWYLIKWGWIQYIAVLFLFIFVFERVKVFIFQNQFVTTHVDRAFKEKKSL
ncbi:transmembrane protein 231-like [Haliotis rubra]|uniref:transmembrane protein 231-like n=1 Tax=Haliotis rubra TaxID=36100 RepID=UPI001EE5E16F|nr:transmembrane protein 231-like [Haliotis rubra]